MSSGFERLLHTRADVRQEILYRVEVGQTMAHIADSAGISIERLHAFMDEALAQPVAIDVMRALRAYLVRAPDPVPSPQDVRQAEATLSVITEEARTLTESRMIPSQPDTAVVESVRAAFIEYAKKHEIKLSRVAKQVSYAESVISEFVNGTYAGDVAKLARAINTWMERDAKRRREKNPEGYVTTVVAERFKAIVANADACNRMAAIVAPAGIGKTMLAQTLADQMRGIYIRCDEGMRPRSFFRKLAGELGHRARLGTLDELMQYCVNAMAGTNRILFLDEAQQLHRNVLTCVRTLHDTTQVPIILLGTAEILDTIDDRLDGRGQFSSRCIRHNVMDFAREIPNPDGGGSKAYYLFTQEEIRAFFAGQQIRLTREALDLLHALACLPNHGTLRLVLTIGKLAAKAARGETVDARHVVSGLQIFAGKVEAQLVERHARGIVRAIKKGSNEQQAASAAAAG